MSHSSDPELPTAAAAPPVVLHVSDAEDMLALGARIARLLLPLPPGGFVIDLRGDLGMGKTVFARGAGAGLGVPARTPIVSPTFTIARSYQGTDSEGRSWTLHHLDAYRLGGIEDLEAAGFEEMCEDGALTCVEWGDRVADALPEDRLEIRIDMDAAAAARLEQLEPGAVPVFPRRLTFIAHGARAQALLQCLGPTESV